MMQTFVHIFSIAAWVAVDQSFFPWSPFLAMMSSWVLGHSLLLSLGYYMPKMQKLSRDALNTEVGVTFIGTLFVNILLMAQGLGVVMSWHGHWVLYDVLKSWIPIQHGGNDVTPFYEVLVSFAILTMCHVSSVLVRRGLSSDIAEECVDGLCGNMDYFTHYYKEHIEGKDSENNNQKQEEGVAGNVSDVVKAMAKPSAGSKPPFQRKEVTLQGLVEIDRKKREQKKTK